MLGCSTAGHPENILHPAIEVSTGPLGQGLSNAVGMAIAQEHLAAEFNRPGHTVVDNSVFVICGDGCLQEGVTAEASSLAGHLGLGRLILLYDDNHITIDGETGLSFTEDVLKRYEAYGWHTQHVADGTYYSRVGLCARSCVCVCVCIACVHPRCARTCTLNTSSPVCGVSFLIPIATPPFVRMCL